MDTRQVTGYQSDLPGNLNYLFAQIELQRVLEWINWTCKLRVVIIIMMLKKKKLLLGIPLCPISSCSHSVLFSKDCDLMAANATAFTQYCSSDCSGYCLHQCKCRGQEIDKYVFIYVCVVPWKYNYFVHLILPLIKQVGINQRFLLLLLSADGNDY